MARRRSGQSRPEADARWYQNAVIYQLHVRSLYDSNGDGIGDFRGLTEKLDYLQDLGVTALWLLPFYPSPLRDDGYDIADYTGVHESYGSLTDFRRFLREAHRRGLRVITELVLNHTSDQHPWFQRARKASPGSRARELYVWSDTPDRYRDTRVIFKDFEASNWAWDPTAQAYYWHRFYSHQPDLNFDNPAVHEALFQVIDKWLGMGVDGLRLDAVPYLYEREGTTCENLPETHAFLRRLRDHVEAGYRDRMLLAEANQWPEDAVAYFGGGKECHMAFHFPLMPRLFMAVRMEDRFPVLDILEQTPEIPKGCQWAVFLRNHDELTLEMVTDEERDYMYRVYANDPRARINLGIRRRLAPLLGNDRRRIELLNGLLFSLPGTPIIYYGDEIGMGDNIYLGDRNGVRTPMQWSPDRNAGFSRANPQSLFLPVIIDPEYHFQSVNVEAQQNNPHSLLWWMKRLIALRKRYEAFGRGTIEFLQPDNRKVLAFVRREGEQRILVLANLSRFVQYVELDLAEFRGMVPVELFSRSPFPAIGELPYFVTLGPHGFYWFALESGGEGTSAEAARPSGSAVAPPEVAVADGPGSVFQGRARAALDGALPGWLAGRRWFGAKARRVRSASIRDVITLPRCDPPMSLVLVEVNYLEDEPELYLLSLCGLEGGVAEEVLSGDPLRVLARLRSSPGGPPAVLCEAASMPGFGKAVLAAISGRRRVRGEEGEVLFSSTRRLRALRGEDDLDLEPSVLRGEQSNTSIVFGERYVLKIFRRLQAGPNPDLEIGRFLTRRGFAGVPPVAGFLEYRSRGPEPITLAILQGYVANQGDAWSYTLDVLERYFSRALSAPREEPAPSAPQAHLLVLAAEEVPEAVYETVGTYAEAARMLGLRTADLHLALASDPNDPAFAPEPFTALSRRSVYQSMRTLTHQVFTLLRRRQGDLPAVLQDEVSRVQKARTEVLRRMRTLADSRIEAARIRCHGDFHLGQVLHTGKDFVIIDFEGEPARSLSERRFKRSPLRDVAGMLRSFHYAAWSGLIRVEEGGMAVSEDAERLEGWADFWTTWVGAIFLRSYLERAREGTFLPATEEGLRVLLDVFLLEKVVYELGYELNNRPDWVRIPLRGLEQLLSEEGTS